MQDLYPSLIKPFRNEHYPPVGWYKHVDSLSHEYLDEVVLPYFVEKYKDDEKNFDFFLYCLLNFGGGNLAISSI